MKIGIYGDSFSEPISNLNTKLGDSWVSYLTNKKLFITNYSEVGSSLWISYRKYLDTHHLYNKCIFLITSETRFPITDFHITGPDSIDFLIKNNRIPDTDFYNDLSMGIKQIYSRMVYEYMRDIHLGLYRHLITVSPHKTLFLPSFHNEFYKELNHNCSLFDISSIDLNEFNLTSQTMAINENRNCHMNPENNYILGNKVLQWILQGNPLSLNINDFVKSKYKKEDLFLSNL